MGATLSFLGAARNVTGSRYLLEANGSKILVDCGLYQEREMRERNWDRFAVPPGSIDAILLTHAHLDHCGFLPRLVKDGFRGKVYCTAATAEIAEIALLDSAHLLVEDAQYKKRRHEREGRKGPYPEVALYTEDDARNSFRHFTTVEFGTPVEVGPGMRATFCDAGHILGAAHVKIDLEADGGERTLVFSGDIGRWNRPILTDPTLFEQVDYLVMESTYGNRLHEDPKDLDAMIEDIVEKTKRRGGNLVIPSFAIGRTQDLLYCLNCLFLEDRIPHMMVLIDSPMAIRVTEVFKHHRELFDKEAMEMVKEGNSPFSFPSLKMTPSVHDSKAINYIRGTVIIIAGSGMCTGGRIKHHLVNNISRQESTVLFVGYQAGGTLGREIVDGAKQVRILGKMLPVKAHVVQVHGFSAHADRDELLKWLSALKKPPRHVFVTHGEPDASSSFADLLRSKKGWEVSVPRYRDKVQLG
jgi:metallo-beta-lactamase family protein